jgi:hypothetical protein
MKLQGEMEGVAQGYFLRGLGPPLTLEISRKLYVSLRGGVLAARIQEPGRI